MSTQHYSVQEAGFRDHAQSILRLWTDGLAGVTGASAAHKLEHGYFANPSGEGRCIVLHTTSTPQPIGVQCLHIRRFLIDQRELRAAALADYVVSPEHRSLGPALQLLKQSVAIGVGSYDLVYGMPNQKSLAVCKRVRLNQIGLLERYGRLLKLRFVYRSSQQPVWFKLGAPLADALLGAVDGLYRLIRGKRIQARDAAWSTPDIDTIWGQRTPALLLCERNRANLAWRYGPDPASQGWTLTVLSRGSQPIAYVVWRIEQDIAVVSDYFCAEPESDLLDVLLAFCAHARRHDACAISLEFFGSPGVAGSLKRAGFIAKEGGAPVVLQFAPGTAAIAPEQFYLTSYERDLN